jgi:hypothetical protein
MAQHSCLTLQYLSCDHILASASKRSKIGQQHILNCIADILGKGLNIVPADTLSSDEHLRPKVLSRIPRVVP